MFFSTRLETGVFVGRPADFLFMLIFNYICSAIVSLSLWYLWSQWSPHMMEPMVMSILYIWCQINKESIVQFLYGTQLPAVYLPWVLFGIKFIIFREIFCWKENTTNILSPHRISKTGSGPCRCSRGSGLEEPFSLPSSADSVSSLVAG